MGNILQFPKIHRKYKVLATRCQVVKALYVLFLHKKIRSGFNYPLFLDIKEEYTSFLVKYPMQEINQVFDEIILDCTIEDFPELSIIISKLNQKSLVSK